MAKKLLATNYTLNVDSDKVTIKGFYRGEQFQLITDATPNSGGNILFNFADASKGYKDVTFDPVTELTTIQLEADLSALGLVDSSNLQIIVDHPETEMEVSDALLDPVHKIRVSTPENLIDTDFEYGLQPTKWETLELSNNVPSFFVADGDTALNNVVRIEATSGSNVIKVTTNDQHNLVVGTPIDVSGLDARTAEGKFLITQADSEQFYYKANAPQTITGEIGSIYSAITPGSFYAGSAIAYQFDSGLTSDQAVESKVTITTQDKHGFVPGSSFYLVNTIASKKNKLITSGTAPDGRNFIDPDNTLSTNLTVDMNKMRTTQMRARWSRFFPSSDVNTTSNTITWPNHNLRKNYTLLYNPPANGAQIGGLARFDFYYVIVVDANTIQLSDTYDGSAINFTNAGNDQNGQHSLHLAYEIRYSYKGYRNSYTYHYPWAWQYGADASGHDLKTYTDNSYGLGEGAGDAWMVVVRDYNYPGDAARWLSYYTPEYHQHNTAYSNQTNWRIPQYDPSYSGNIPSRWNFLEHWNRWDQYPWAQYRPYVNQNSPYIRIQTYYYSGTYNYYWNNKNIFIIPLVQDAEADTFFAQNHGLETGDQVSIATTGGVTNIQTDPNNAIGDTQSYQSLPDGNYEVEVPSPDRFRLANYRIAYTSADSDNSYIIGAATANPTANSFFIQDHGLITGNDVTVQQVGSPTLPTQDTSVLLPNWAQQNGNQRRLFQAVDQAVETKINSQTNHLGFYTANHNGNSEQLIDGYYGTSNGAFSGIYYINTRYTNSYAEYYKNNSRLGYGYPNAQDTYLGRMNETTPVNLFETYNNTMRDMGLMRMATNWQQKTQIPYYVEVTTASPNAHEPDDASDNWWRYDNYSYMRTYTYYSQTRRQVYTKVGASTGDTYVYEFSCVVPGYSSYRMVQLNATITNRSWYNYNNGNTFDNYWYGGGSYQVHYNQSRLKQGFQVRLWFMLTGSQSFNANTDAKGYLDAIVDQVDSLFAAKPSFAVGDTVEARVYNDNRFAIAKNNTIIDLTNSGSYDSSNYLEFVTAEVAGAGDGSYTTDSVSDFAIKIQTPFELTGNSEFLNANTVTSNYDIRVLDDSGTHPFLSGTKVTYTADSAMNGLVSGQQYYVYATDDKYIRLTNSYEDAVTGAGAIAIGGGDSADVHSITTNSIAGRTPGEGTISVNSGSYRVTGTETLFKRYFKAGDKIFIQFDSDVPGELFENTVALVSDDETMVLEQPAQTSGSALKHYVTTSIYTKPDGYSVHRPFDGGVEIGAGTAPFSQIMRQTRKYFRYQSGKGIQTSLAINFNPPVILEQVTASGTTINCRTKYPHRLTVGQTINVVGASDSGYNGNQTVATLVDDYNFTYTVSSEPSTSIPGGIIQYTVDGYSDVAVRAGMFDQQNGFFFQWDGQVLNCVRRSSTTQLSGSIRATKGTGLIEGTNTNFTGQLNKGDKVVIRGQTYKIVSIENRTKMYVQPQYRGVSTDGVILTKTEDLVVPQDDWNLDKCDGTGKEGFVLDMTKIQMAYMDYSWYGAGKIRFGFKDRKGHVRYVHEFIHNNRLDEAYMRSGNLPAKYEIENGENPTYAPTLFHWGTSVIMDGTFDDDKAYLFTAPSKNLSFTNGQSLSAATSGGTSLTYQYNRGTRQYDFYLRIPFATSHASKFSTGTKLYTNNGELDGQEVAYTDYSGSTFRVHIYISSGYRFPSAGTYPNVTSGQTVYIGQPSSGGDTVNLGTQIIPLVSLRLAPSVDNNLTGNLGERDIINRMQLKLNEVGLILTHDCEVKLILNGDITNVTWENVASPSLSQLIKHESTDQITGGTEVFSFRAAGGVDGNSISSNFPLGDLIDMGNSILGGDGIFPNGPDILTVAVQVVDTSSINASQPFTASSRITWSESQA